MSSPMVNSGRLLTIYSTWHQTVVKVSAVVKLFFNNVYKHLFIVLIRLCQQSPIHRLRERSNCYLILCLFKYVIILLRLRFLISSLICFTKPMELVLLLDRIMFRYTLCARNLRNDRIKESFYRPPVSSIFKYYIRTIYSNKSFKSLKSC